MLIPERAIMREQRGAYVLTVGGENKVEKVTIRVGQTISGWAIVQPGLDPDARVIIDGLHPLPPPFRQTL